MSKMQDRYFKGYVKEKRLMGETGKYQTSYVYHGDYYYWKAGPGAAAHYKKLFGALTAVNLAVMLAISLLNSQASRSAYVMAPVVLALIPLVYQVIGVVQFVRTGDKVREFDFEEINKKLRFASLGNGGLMALAAVLAVVWACFSVEKWSFVLLAVLDLAGSACALAIHVRYKSLGAVLTEEGDYRDIKDEGP
ncbi:MAG: hypothetical protein K2P04_10870 [Oscillospiraceae bacterium]|nr:hypothetical protein [Oscillospiraceae bacterium]